MAAILVDDIFKCIFLNENDRIQIEISLKFFPKSPIDNKPALVQAMLGSEQATSHYLNQCWPSSPTYAALGENKLRRINFNPSINK